MEGQAALGSNVLYGAVIQLQHVATEKFVVLQKALAVTERDSYRVRLDAGEEGAWWRICPAYKFRQVCGPVLPSDPGLQGVGGGVVNKCQGESTLLALLGSLGGNREGHTSIRVSFVNERFLS